MNDAFEELHAALDDLWQHIKCPFEWAAAHPFWVCAYVVVLSILMVLDVLSR